MASQLLPLGMFDNALATLLTNESRTHRQMCGIKNMGYYEGRKG